MTRAAPSASLSPDDSRYGWTIVAVLAVTETVFWGVLYYALAVSCSRCSTHSAGRRPSSDHPMHHPFHIHGAGRFVVPARDGVPEQNLVWKDTVLVRTGETVDILLDVT